MTLGRKMDIREAAGKAVSQSKSGSWQASPGTSQDGSSTAAVDALFARFGAIYGAKFSLQWAGVDPVELKRTWLDALCRFRAEEVGAALEACARDVKFPPTLPEFIDICRSYASPQAPLPSLEYTRPILHKRTAAELQVEREFPKPAHGKGRWWARRILRLVELGEPPPFISIRAAQEVLGVSTAADMRATTTDDLLERAAIQGEG